MKIDLGKNLNAKKDLEDFGTPYLTWLNERLSFYAEATMNELRKRAHAKTLSPDREPPVIPVPPAIGDY